MVRSGLITVGVIFLVIGVLLLYNGMTAGARTTVVGEGEARTWYTAIQIPPLVTVGILIIGAVLFLLGLIIPAQYVREKPQVPHVVERTERVEGAGTKRKVVRRTKEEYSG